jgi:rRNA maturation endonuclease Nob1
MLDNFRKIYNTELKHYYNALERKILDSIEVRAFVYMICEECLQDKALTICPACGHQSEPVLHCEKCGHNWMM